MQNFNTLQIIPPKNHSVTSDLILESWVGGIGLFLWKHDLLFNLIYPTLQLYSPHSFDMPGEVGCGEKEWLHTSFFIPTSPQETKVSKHFLWNRKV